MKRHFVLSLLTTCLLLSSLASSQDYTLTKLPTLGGLSTRAFAINEAGLVTGSSDTTTYPHAIIWSRGGVLQDLGALGGQESTGAALNNNGDVAGYVNRCFCQFDAFLWTPTTGMTTINSTNQRSSLASGINIHRQIVGIYVVDTSSKGFLWTPANGMQDLGSLGCANCFPNAINDNGQVVGWVVLADGSHHAFRWTKTGGIKDLGTLGGPNSEAHAINAAGQVVGMSDTADGVQHAFFWTSGSGIQDLGTLPGESYSSASSISAAGQVVGSSWNPGKVKGLPFTWTKAHGMTQLGPFAPQLVGADGVNKAGQILVSTYNPTPGYSSYLLTPIMYTTLTSSPNPSQAGQPITFTATVSSSVQGPPPDGESVTFMSGQVLLGTAPLKGGVATFTMTLNASRTLRAVYSGDSNYVSSHSASLSQVVVK